MCQTAINLIIHLGFYILLPLSYHFCLTNSTSILNQCRKTRFVRADAWTEGRSQPQLNMWSVSLVDLTRRLPASLRGSGLLDRHVSSKMKEHESRPSFVSWLRAEGPRLQHDTPSHSRVSGLHSSGAPPESGHFSSRESVHVSSCKLGLSVQRPGATGRWPAWSPLSSSLYGLQWGSFHCLLQGEGYDQRRALFNFFVSSLFNIVNLNCPLTNNHLNVKDFWRFEDFLLKEIKSKNDGWIPMQKWEYINGHLAPLMNHWLGWQLVCITHVWEQHIGPLCDVYGICGNGKWNNDHN